MSRRERRPEGRVIHFRTVVTAAGALVVCGLACIVPARGDVVPAACFGSHMVLQRDLPLPVWGTAAPGERVTVSFGGGAATTVADAEGRWQVRLAPQAASDEPRALVIRGANEVRCDDVLVGEVVLCAGQSNMLLPLAQADEAALEIAAADRPRLRLLTLHAAAGGDPPAYTSEQIRDLVPARFCTGSWEVSTPQTARSFSAVGYFLGAAVGDELGVPVGVICAAVGGAPTESWIGRRALAGDRRLAPLVQGDWMHNPALAGWCVTRAGQNLARARQAGEPIPGDPLGPNHPFKPGFLHESCIAPLAPLAIRGVAWYQGESNADSPARVAQHAALLPVLVADWRRAWGRADLPFAVVQLPGMDRPDWPAFRETQRRAVADLARAALVVTIDLGRKTDVHPPDKRPVGERLARWAVAEARGRAGADASGPLPVGATLRPDGGVTIRFRPEGANLRTTDGEPPRHFEVADSDGPFVAAVARIEGTAVVVTPPAGVAPRRVRYAWRPFPEPPVNLVDPDGIPAAPFEVDVVTGE